jgi:hypothetical protein
MLAVITIDQRGSRLASEDWAETWAHSLNSQHREELTLPFTPTVGDEIQGVTISPLVIVEILLGGVRMGDRWLGLGIGTVESPLRKTAGRSRGAAFYRARDAVEAAKKSRHGFAVRAEDPAQATDIQTVLELLAFLIRRRGKDRDRWQAVEMAMAGTSTVRIGKALGITQQAASKRLLNAGVHEEMAGRNLAERMIESAMGEPGAQ